MVFQLLEQCRDGIRFHSTAALSVSCDRNYADTVPENKSREVARGLHVDSIDLKGPLHETVVIRRDSDVKFPYDRAHCYRPFCGILPLS